MVKVDLDGLMDRIVGLPIETANYGDINVVGDSVYYGRFKPLEDAPSLMLYDLAELKEKDLGKVDGYEISADGKKMLVAEGRRLRHHRPAEGPIKLETKLDLSGMEVALDRARNGTRSTRSAGGR